MKKLLASVKLFFKQMFCDHDYEATNETSLKDHKGIISDMVAITQTCKKCGKEETLIFIIPRH